MASMETTFISIHDLSEHATTLYSSDSVIDVLGFTPEELVNVSAWELFHPDDVPMARKIHERKMLADKAAVLVYCRIKDKAGQWIGCECCFTIVYDVMIACTSIYKRGLNSEKRALEAPLIRRVFSSSPQDPRYHMLTHISAKFRLDINPALHEPRAALFLNRFTRTLTIMYATNGLKEIIGIPAEEMRGRSFYYCIAENCLSDAIKCLENAKANNSLAYLRFWFRDPRSEDEPQSTEDSDEEMTTDADDDLDESVPSQSPHGQPVGPVRPASSMDVDNESGVNTRSRNSSGESTRPGDTHEAIFGEALAHNSSASSVGHSPDEQRSSPTVIQHDPIELEAVISCATDGLVVCLRRARPMIPHPTHRPSKPVYARGLFAAPWATTPTLPPLHSRAAAGYTTDFAPSLGPNGSARRKDQSTATAKSGGPDQHDYMNAIREQAIFAWALTGINGALFEHGTGKPLGEAVPQEGLPVWAKEASQDDNSASSNDKSPISAPPSDHDTIRIGPQIFGDPGLDSFHTRGGSRRNSSIGRPHPLT